MEIRVFKILHENNNTILLFGVEGNALNERIIKR